MQDDDRKFSTIDALRTAVWAGAGLILSYIGVSTSESISTLGNELSHLRVAIVKLEAKVERLPPPELTQKLDHILAEQDQLVRELERQQTLIDRLENAVRDSGIKLSKAPPYVERD